MGGESPKTRILTDVASLSATSWRPLEDPDFPFTDWEFLAALELSDSLGERTGWLGAHHLVEADGLPQACLLQYDKTNSYGEYIFDWDWAKAYEVHGLEYYPKKLTAVPFTPATGPRILVAPDAPPTMRADLIAAATRAYDAGTESSLHALFIPEDESELWEGVGLLRRTGQFHWRNRGYRDFEDYLDALTGKRRRQIARERRDLPTGWNFRALTGDELTPAHADLMYRLYESTIDRKWAFPYLTQDFFRRVFATMADRILLAVGEEAGEIRAASLSFHKGKKLFGRYWGTFVPDARNVHFEICYYQTVEFAISRGMTLVEAGAQGPHKHSRGFDLCPVMSVHRIRDERFREAIRQYIRQETATFELSRRHAASRSPYREMTP